MMSVYRLVGDTSDTLSYCDGDSNTETRAGEKRKFQRFATLNLNLNLNFFRFPKCSKVRGFRWLSCVNEEDGCSGDVTFCFFGGKKWMNLDCEKKKVMKFNFATGGWVYGDSKRKYFPLLT